MSTFPNEYPTTLRIWNQQSTLVTEAQIHSPSIDYYVMDTPDTDEPDTDETRYRGWMFFDILEAEQDSPSILHILEQLLDTRGKTRSGDPSFYTVAFYLTKPIQEDTIPYMFFERVRISALWTRLYQTHLLRLDVELALHSLPTQDNPYSRFVSHTLPVL